MMFLLHSSYRLFCCWLHHVGSACGWSRPNYCDYCSSHQSSRWEHSHQHLFGLMNTNCQFRAEMLLCALFSREPETAGWQHCELKIRCSVSKYHLGFRGTIFDSIFVLLFTGASWWRRRLSDLWKRRWPLCLCIHRSTMSTSTHRKQENEELNPGKTIFYCLFPLNYLDKITVIAVEDVSLPEIFTMFCTFGGVSLYHNWEWKPLQIKACFAAPHALCIV